jgi:hypothetical protein
MSVLENSKTSPDVSGHARSALFWIGDVSKEFKIIQCRNIRNDRDWTGPAYILMVRARAPSSKNTWYTLADNSHENAYVEFLSKF